MNRVHLIYLYTIVFCILFIQAGLAVKFPEKQSDDESDPNARSLKQLTLDDFVMIEEDKIGTPQQTYTQNFTPQDMEEEGKKLITQGVSSAVSGAFGFFGSGLLSQTILGYVGYKIGTKVLPPFLDYYGVSLPSRYTYPLYRVGVIVYEKGEYGLEYIYNAMPPVKDRMTQLVFPPPPPEELEMIEYSSEK